MLVIKDLHSDISDQFWLFYGYKYNIKRLIQSQKMKVKVQNELQCVTDANGNVQWQLKYRLVPKTQPK